jgi:two-component system, NtrC family, response regulator HydG
MPFHPKSKKTFHLTFPTNFSPFCINSTYNINTPSLYYINMKKKILIVEDDTAFALMLRTWFQRNQFEVETCAKQEEAKKILLQQTFDLLLFDYRLPDGDGISLLSWFKEQPNISPVPVFIMTSYAEIQNAVRAIKLGAFDYLEKPINPSVLSQKIEQALVQKQSPLNLPSTGKSATPPPRKQIEVVWGESKASQKMYEYINLVAPTQLSVLIRGESGTGKEYAAKAIHEKSRRNAKPFLAIDCGSLSKELAPSELFGHLKGSFTSAIDNKKGAFEQTNGGTLFLDEVGNLSYDVQVQLLRAVQEMKVRPVGSSSDIDVNVRIIVATNENLETAIAEGRFREDLFHRLNEFSLVVPPLRERTGDLPHFAEHFLEKANEELQKQLKGFSPECMKALEAYNWPGNLRELRNAIRRMALFAQSEYITKDNLPDLLQKKHEPEIATELSLKPKDEKQQIENAIKMAKGNKSLAAQLLNIDRKTLYNKIHLYGIEL